uniref:Reverse transcriptase domain-containing protein n=1 Tax=Tanacetum cinerariifolium TaxID=118510 RepID=A0A6L2L473_TANCI|nr:reverse transcriptase domain-containing protein [Tanacetum cinerariifolium]
MDKVRRDKQKEVHARLDFGEGSMERRTKKDSHYSSTRALIARLERLKVRDHLRYNDRHVLDRLGHRREIAFDRLSETYSPSTTKSRPGRTNSRDHPRGRSRPQRLDASNEGFLKDMECFRNVGESYDDSHSHSYHDKDRSRHMKRRRDSKSPFPAYQKVILVMEELTKCLNEHVPKTMEEMMITTTAFIRGEAITASKKKGHTSWRTQDQSKSKLLKRGLTSEVIQGMEGGLAEIQAVPSTAYRMLKFPDDDRIVTIRSTILIPAECATVITSSEIPKETHIHHENFKVALHPNFPDQEVPIGGTLSAKGRAELCSLLKENLDIFAWQPSDVT